MKTRLGYRVLPLVGVASLLGLTIAHSQPPLGNAVVSGVVRSAEGGTAVRGTVVLLVPVKGDRDASEHVSYGGGNRVYANKGEVQILGVQREWLRGGDPQGRATELVKLRNGGAVATDIAGQFQFDRVNEGEYRLHGLAAGFLWRKGQTPAVSGPRKPAVEIALEPLRCVRGTVLHPDGKPLVNASLQFSLNPDQHQQIIALPGS